MKKLGPVIRLVIVECVRRATAVRAPLPLGLFFLRVERALRSAFMKRARGDSGPRALATQNNLLDTR